MSRAHSSLAVVFLAIGVALLVTPWLRLWDAPFDHGWLGRNGARYSIAARNLLRLPLEVTHGAPCLQSGAVDAEGTLPYLRHPPLFPLLVASSFRLFGESENAARAVPQWFTLMTAATLAAMAARRNGRFAGAAAFSCFALLPMSVFYGSHVDVQSSPTLFFVVLAAFLLEKEADSGLRRFGVFAAVSLLLAMQCDWPGYLALLCFPLLRVRQCGWRSMPPWILIGAAAIAGFLWWASTVPFGSLGSLQSAARERSSDVLVLLERDDAKWVLRGFVDGLLALLPWWSLLGGLLCAMLSRPLLKAGFASIPALFLVATLHVVLFPAGALIHDYWAYLLAAPLALLLSQGIASLDRRTESWRLVFRGFLCGLFLWLGWQLIWRPQSSWNTRLLREEEVHHRLLGRALGEITRFEDRILTNAPYNPLDSQRLTDPAFSYYADRKVRGSIGTSTALERGLEQVRATHYLKVFHPLWRVEADLEGRLQQFRVEARLRVGTDAPPAGLLYALGPAGEGSGR